MIADLDEIQVQILVGLQEDPRISISDLSKRVDASRPTVVKVLNEMLEDDIIMLSAGLNARKNNCKIANVGVNVDDLNIRSNVIDVLSKCPKILNLYRTTDQANLLLTICGTDEESITSTINCIGDLDNVNVMYSHFLGVPLKKMRGRITVGDNTNTPCGKNCERCVNYENSWCNGCYTFQST